MSNGEGPVRRRRTTYTPEYKADAVAMVLDTGRTIAEVARGLGIGDQTLGVWVKQTRIDRGQREGLSSEERAELVRLRRELAKVTEERDLLKRATAFWVKESTR